MVPDGPVTPPMETVLPNPYLHEFVLAYNLATALLLRQSTSCAQEHYFVFPGNNSHGKSFLLLYDLFHPPRPSPPPTHIYRPTTRGNSLQTNPNPPNQFLFVVQLEVGCKTAERSWWSLKSLKHFHTRSPTPTHSIICLN